VVIAYKAQKLTYLRENIYQESEIITEVRPVFDQKAGQILEYLVTHSLIATYFRHGRYENIHLAMDMADVLKLRRLCDRAILKAKTLQSDLGDKARILRDDDENP
jgi:RIO-like serine/threonine protein kinase